MTALDRLEDVQHLRQSITSFCEALDRPVSATDKLMLDRLERHLQYEALDDDRRQLRAWAIEQAIAGGSPLHAIRRDADILVAYVHPTTKEQ